jgi:hypothetical protein
MLILFLFAYIVNIESSSMSQTFFLQDESIINKSINYDKRLNEIYFNAKSTTFYVSETRYNLAQDDRRADNYNHGFVKHVILTLSQLMHESGGKVNEGYISSLNNYIEAMSYNSTSGKNNSKNIKRESSRIKKNEIESNEKE